jgi:hypothetical protein
VFDGSGRFVSAMLGPAKRPSGKEAERFLRRLLRAIRVNWPRTKLLLRADSHYCTPETIDFCRANGLDFTFGVAPTTTLRSHILGLEARTKAAFEAAPSAGKARRYKELLDGAQSWSRVERIIARTEAGPDGVDTRFVVTNLEARNARRLYEDVYCRRGQAENHIKSWKTHLCADRTSCMKATVNQLRLFLHAGAYWIMWGLRMAAPKRSLADGSVRYSALAPREDRRACRRDEDRHQNPYADELSRSAILPHRALAHSAPRDMTGGASAPEIRTLFRPHPSFRRSKLRPAAGAAGAARASSGTRKMFHFNARAGQALHNRG